MLRRTYAEVLLSNDVSCFSEKSMAGELMRASVHKCTRVREKERLESRYV
jgi:hypothetical protein